MGPLRLNYLDSSFGQLHYAEQGEGRALVLLHQAPRSWDEFREFMPLVADDRRVIAMDMVGFGASAALAGPQTIEMYSQAVVELLDGLGISAADVLGHHTGALVALDVAARWPERVRCVVLSSCPFTGPDRRAAPKHIGGVDQAIQREDGGHLIELWGLRRPFYPEPAAALLDRFVHDALAHGVDPAEGHRACSRYRIEDTIGSVVAPTLLLGASQDRFAMPYLPELQSNLSNSAAALESVVVEGGKVAFFEEKSAVIAQVVLSFLARHPWATGS